MAPFRFYLITDRLHGRHAPAAVLPALARALLSERTLLKPNGTAAWRKYAEVLAGLGDDAAAAEAARRAEAVSAA